MHFPSEAESHPGDLEAPTSESLAEVRLNPTV